MRILVTNDDGVHSPGIAALAQSLTALGEVWIVAPDRERSAASHAISLHHPIRISKVREHVYATDGTPTDCVYLGVNHLMKEAKPDLIASGINHGPNVADDITYSGTVAAALEGTMLGVPSVAFSLCARGKALDELDAAARFAQALVKAILENGLPRGVLINVNIPAGSDGATYRITRQGRRSYGQEVIEREDPRGRRYYWIGGSELAHGNLPGSDANAVYDERVISVTPLHLDMTHEGMREKMMGWTMPGMTPRGEAA